MKLSDISQALLVPVATVKESIPYSQYILAPSSRTLYPATVYNQTGNVTSPQYLLPGQTGSTVFSANSSVTYDFGKNIAGLLSFNVDTINGTSSIRNSTEVLGFTFSESSLWISTTHCDATQSIGLDDPLFINVPAASYYSAPRERQRGGFRYMTIVYNSTTNSTLSISNVTIAFTSEPTLADPSVYSGYFHSSSEKLNRVWYAGAYTNNMCVIDSNEGGALNQPLDYWYYNETLTTYGPAVLVDGAKRDRLIVRPGDIAISGPSIYVSTANVDSLASGISLLFSQQQTNGQLPYMGSVNSGFSYSFTYHLHTLIDLYDYYMFTGDVGYLSSLWNKFKLAMTYTIGLIDDTGLANVDSSADWLRMGMYGHNIEANAIFFDALGKGIELAAVLNDTTVAEGWTHWRDLIQSSANTLLFDALQNLFLDNDAAGTTLHPQDGNSYALLSGLVNDTARASNISAALAARWIKPYGAPAPEAGATISPFASGFELRGHYAAGHPERAVELIEFMWADFMLDDPRMTNSTFIEGYATNGDLTYVPYSANAPRISHAHGWSTGPTSSLTLLGAGIVLTSGAGKTWKIQPALGGLDSIEAGYKTSLGSFSASWWKGGKEGNFTVPTGTSGSLVITQLSSVSAVDLSSNVATGSDGSCDSTTEASKNFQDGKVTFENLCGGGTYTVTLR